METEHSVPMTKQRIESFTDGVFAVIITILVLDLHFPNVSPGSNFHSYLAAMSPLLPKLFSFALSFVLVGIYWINHHYFFRFIEKGTNALIWTNNLLLLWVCLVPFSTSVLGEHPTDSFPVALYGANLLLAALAFFLLRLYARRANLLKGNKHEMKLLSPLQSLPSIVINSLAIALAFVNVYLSLLLFVIFPLWYFMPAMWDQLRHRFFK